MNKYCCIFALCILGCLQQGVKGVYYVMMETEPFDSNGDGAQDGVRVFVLFKDRDLLPVSFYDAECTAVLKVYQGDIVVYEREIMFDSSELVGRPGGGIIVTGEEAGVDQGDIRVKVIIEGRGVFRTEKKNVVFR